MLLLFPVLLLAAMAGRAEDSQTNKTDLARLQGEWSMVSGSRGGSKLTPKPNSKRTRHGNEVTVIVGGNLIMKANITPDAAKNPKTVDYKVVEGPYAGTTMLGIYEFDGDTVKFSYAVQGKDRPADFTTAGGDGRTSSVWRRAAP